MFRSGDDKYFHEGITVAKRAIRNAMNDGKDVDLTEILQANRAKTSRYDQQKDAFERGVKKAAAEYDILFPDEKTPVVQAMVAPKKSSKRKRYEEDKTVSVKHSRVEPKLSAAPALPLETLANNKLPLSFSIHIPVPLRTNETEEEEGINILATMRKGF